MEPKSKVQNLTYTISLTNYTFKDPEKVAVNIYIPGNDASVYTLGPAYNISRKNGNENINALFIYLDKTDDTTGRILNSSKTLPKTIDLTSYKNFNNNTVEYIPTKDTLIILFHSNVQSDQDVEGYYNDIIDIYNRVDLTGPYNDIEEEFLKLKIDMDKPKKAGMTLLKYGS
jgi:hypothetical protein